MSLTKVTYSMIDGAVFNALDYGAVADGVVNDATAINAAITAANTAGGGIVALPAGTYAVSAPILLKSNVTLQGDGYDATIVKQTGTIAGWDAITTSSGVITTLEADEFENIHVKGLKLEGLYSTPIPDGSANYAVNGISIANTVKSSVTDCKVQDTGTGIIIYGTVTGAEIYENLIANCFVTNARSWIMAGNSGTPRGITMATNHSTVQDCVSDDNHTGYFIGVDYGNYINCRTTRWSDDGFYVNANFCTFTNCYAIGDTTLGTASGSGFAVNPSYGHTFTGCVALRCPNAGMRFRHAAAIAPSSNRVIGCWFSDCGYGFLDDMIGANAYPQAVSSFNVFIGNQADQCQQSGFKFIRQQSAVISGNTAWDNNKAGVSLQTRGGISLDEYCLDNAISDNICGDTTGSPTQTFGLYSYPASVSGASVENTGNRVNHKSINGVDLFYPATQSGTEAVTISNGTRAVVGSVTFALPFESTPVVTGGVQNSNALADAERPVSVTVFNLTTTGFDFSVDAYANVAAGRNLTIGWTANQP
jgi:hypothetical protein